MSRLTEKRKLIADSIKSSIKSKGLKQKWVAMQIGVTESYLTMLLTGDRNVPLKWICEIERVLETEILTINKSR